jgi:hypothetical protein
MKSISFNEELNQKKRRIYKLLLISTVSTFAMVIGFNYYLVEIRGSSGTLFFEISKQRSDSQFLINTFAAGVESQSSFNDIKLKTQNWVNENALFVQQVHEKNEHSPSIDELNANIEVMDKAALEIEELINSITDYDEVNSILRPLVKEHEKYVSALNVISKINFATYAADLNRLIVLVTIIVFISLVVFAYLFIFQIRPLFNQIFHKNEELRNISSKQSHIYRAPLANILGLLYLIENAETIDEVLEYVRLIKLNAEAMDQRIHKVVQHAEQLHNYDGQSTETLNELIVVENEKLL